MLSSGFWFSPDTPPQLCHDFDEGELKKAFRKMSRSYHPDKVGGNTDAFERITAAHDTLADAKRRHEYDMGADLERQLERDGSQGECQPKSNICTGTGVASIGLRTQ